jgi:DNA mismatch repair protein MutL
MAKINILDDETINRIAAGEVVERPSSVVKELVENAIDAGATSVSVEIKDGGISYIRITDNGSGIEKGDIKKAFMRHATSKIDSGASLLDIHSLGFRGEALSSIAAVSKVTLITKTENEEMGSKFVIEGGIQKEFSETGANNGTSFIVENLFFNTPVRRKFLKTATTEGTYVSELMERLAVSYPEVSFEYINNSRQILHTNGSGSLKDAIYSVYGRNISNNVVEVKGIRNNNGEMKISGFVGKPVVMRGNRNLENFFVNGRYIKDAVASRSLEDAFKPYAMKHKYPFAVLMIEADPDMVDVNVHPQKKEVRFSDTQTLYSLIFHSVGAALANSDRIKDMNGDERFSSVLERNASESDKANNSSNCDDNNSVNNSANNSVNNSVNNSANSKADTSFESIFNSGSSLVSKVFDMTDNYSPANNSNNVNLNNTNSISADLNNTNSINSNYNNSNYTSFSLNDSVLKEAEKNIGAIFESASADFSKASTSDDYNQNLNAEDRNVEKEGTESAKYADSSFREDFTNKENPVNSAFEGNMASESTSNTDFSDSKNDGFAKNPDFDSVSENGADRNVQNTGVSELNMAKDEVFKNLDAAFSEASNRSDINSQQVLSCVSDAEMADMAKQEELDKEFMNSASADNYRIVGQIFKTYIIVEMKNQLFYIDQHAAHEKIIFERLMHKDDNKPYASQLISPPKIITLTARGHEAIKTCKKDLEFLGFEISPFGGNDYKITAVPADMYGIDIDTFILNLVDGFSGGYLPMGKNDLIRQRLATIACKAAIKGNQKREMNEMKTLVAELLKLENPYHCPHGRPVIISMTRYEMEKKFKRVV